MSLKIYQSANELNPIRSKYNSFLAQFEGAIVTHYTVDYLEITEQFLHRHNIQMCFLAYFEDDEIVAIFPFQSHVSQKLTKLVSLSFWFDFDNDFRNAHNAFLINQHANYEEIIDQLYDFLTVEYRWEWCEFDFHRAKLNPHMSYFMDKFSNVKYQKSLDSYQCCIDKPRHTQKLEKVCQKSIRRMERENINYHFGKYHSITEEQFEQIKHTHTQHQEYLESKDIKRRLIFSDVEQTKMTREIFNLLSKNNQLSLYTIEVDGNIKAFNIVHHQGSNGIALLMGFSPSLRKYQPNRLLNLAIIDDISAYSRLKNIDFGCGKTGPKLDVCNATTQHFDIQIQTESFLIRLMRKYSLL